MPVLRGSVTLSRFSVESDSSDWKRIIPKGLKAGAFEPLDRKSEDDRAAGFVELENADATDFGAANIYSGEYALFAFRVDTLKVRSAELKAELAKWEQAFVKQNGRKPSRGEKTENKASIRHMLLQRAIPVTKTFDIAWNLKTDELQIWAASRTAVEEIVGAIEEAFGVKLLGKVPVLVAKQNGVAEDALMPTPELAGVAGNGEEALDGAA